MKSELIQMRVSADDKARWQDKADQAGLSLSAWIALRCNEDDRDWSLAECRAVSGTELHRAATALARSYVQDRNVLTSWDKLTDYLRVAQAHIDTERFRVLFLDASNGLIADEVMHEGTINHVAVYPREVLKRALQLNALAIIMVHNHPSGNPEPSRADIDMTKIVMTAMKPVGITVHDHVVVGSHGTTSMRSAGLL